MAKELWELVKGIAEARKLREEAVAKWLDGQASKDLNERFNEATHLMKMYSTDEVPPVLADAQVVIWDALRAQNGEVSADARAEAAGVHRRPLKERVIEAAARPTNAEQVTIPGFKPWEGGLQPTPELVAKLKEDTDEVSVTSMTAAEKEVRGTMEAVGPFPAVREAPASIWPASCNESDGTTHVTQEEIESGEVESEEAEAIMDAAEQDALEVLAGSKDLVGEEWVNYVIEQVPQNPFLSLNVFMAASTRRMALRLMGQVRAAVAERGYVDFNDVATISRANSLMIEADRLVENER